MQAFQLQYWYIDPCRAQIHIASNFFPQDVPSFPMVNSKPKSKVPKGQWSQKLSSDLSEQLPQFVALTAQSELTKICEWRK